MATATAFVPCGVARITGRLHGFMRSPWGARGYIRGRIRLPDSALQVFGDVRQWFLTMGDGDLEMSL